MTVFDPDPSLRWLFCMTHPDDELAIAGWIRRLTALGAEVHLSWSHETPEREWEARQAAKALHVPPENLHFHHGPDRVLCLAMPRVFPRIRRMVEAVKPDRIVVAAFEQGHLDHDATNLMVSRCFEGPIFEVPLYHAYCNLIPTINRFADPLGESLLELLPHEVAIKQRIAQAYQSQALWGSLVWYRLLQVLRGEREPVGTVERMRLERQLDYTKPNLPDRLAEKVLETARWKRWLHAVEAFDKALASEDGLQLGQHGL